MSGSWASLGGCNPRDLGEARLQLHYAAQVVAAVGGSLLEARDDDSHPNLGWCDGAAALAGHRIPSATPFRAALRPADLSLLLLDDADTVLARRGLDGVSLGDAHEWMADAIGAHGGHAPAGGLTRTVYELPHHPLAAGGAFSLSGTPAESELAGWFAGAHAAIGERAAAEDVASDVRVWPHHFDIATLITVATDAAGALSQSIGIGLSPGDETTPEPYWYVTPWPYPAADVLPTLGGEGRWHTEGYVAAVLTGTDHLAADDRAGALDTFLTEAVAASKHALRA